MRREIDLAKAEVIDLKGKKYDKDQMNTLVKQASVMVFQKADSYEMLDIGRALNNLEPVKISEDQAEKIKNIIKDPQSGFIFFIHAPICKYITSAFEKPIGNSKKK